HAALHQAAFHRKRGIEAGDGPADDAVVRGEWLGRNALVPDLADAGAAPLDQMEGGLGGAGHGKGGGRNACSRAKSLRMHEISPVGKNRAGPRSMSCAVAAPALGVA